MSPAAKAPKVPSIKPRNGRYLVALMAGAPADRARELRDRMAKTRGILVQYHLDYEKPAEFKITHIPEDVDLVIIIKSQLGHSNEAHVLAAVDRWDREHPGGQSMPLIKTTHKWANIDQLLHKRFGIAKTASLPLSVTSTAYFKPPKAEPMPTPTPPPAVPPSLTPPQAPPEPMVERRRPPTAEELQVRFLHQDTMALVLELRARMAMIGVNNMLISPEEIVFNTNPVKVLTPAAIEQNTGTGTAKKEG